MGGLSPELPIFLLQGGNNHRVTGYTGSITDAAGNALVQSGVTLDTHVQIDTTAPTVSSLTDVTSNGSDRLANRQWMRQVRKDARAPSMEGRSRKALEEVMIGAPSIAAGAVGSLVCFQGFTLCPGRESG